MHILKPKSLFPAGYPIAVPAKAGAHSGLSDKAKALGEITPVGLLFPIGTGFHARFDFLVRGSRRISASMADPAGFRFRGNDGG